jgi:WhiB family redox-sensing transcriptional regulator
MNQEYAKEREIRRLYQIVTTGANCTEYDSIAFFPEAGGMRALAYKSAKEICSRCVVKDDCLSLAILTDETDGVQGGLTPNERAKLVKNTRSSNKL